MKFSIGKKISLGFRVILVAITVVGAFNYYKMADINDDIQVAKNEIIAQTLGLLDMVIEVTEVQGLLTDAALTLSQDPIEEAKKMASAFKQLSKEFKEREKSPETIELVNNIEKDFDEYWETGLRMISGYKQSKEIGDEIMAEFDKDSINISEALEKLREEHVTELNEHFNMMESDAQQSVITSSVVFTLLIVFGIIFSTLLIRSIVSALTSIVEDLTSAASETSLASDQLSSASQDLSTGANQQASSIEETSASLEEISGMIENNVSNSENAVELASKVKAISMSGNESMEKLKNSMKDILDSNEKIEELVKVIGNIGEKTQIMDEIVFQTKLLSFNASVEAERAGEHGRGFAVVAQEVGNLAQMSGNAAQEISVIVKESIANAEVITVENKKRVEEGNGYVVETADVLKEIMESSASVAEGSNQVLSASQEQSNGIKQISTAMSQLDKATQENAATAEETASTSEELNAQVGSLNNSVSILNELVSGTSKKAA